MEVDVCAAVPAALPDLSLPCGSLELADASATLALGHRLAAILIGAAQPSAAAGPALLLLQGELGAGKTCLVQGLAAGLGVSEPITSPTFSLAQHYSGRLADGSTPQLVHLDLYRLEQPAAADELFAQEEEEAAALARAGGGQPVLLAVEWPERLSSLPADAWLLRLEHRGTARKARWWAAGAMP